MKTSYRVKKGEVEATQVFCGRNNVTCLWKLCEQNLPIFVIKKITSEVANELRKTWTWKLEFIKTKSQECPRKM